MSTLTRAVARPPPHPGDNGVGERERGPGRPDERRLRATVVDGEGFREWQQPTEGLDRAFVLAGGGATGIAWEAGIIIGLRDGGIDVRDADTMIGTSAGSMVAAHLRVGTDEGNAFARIQQGAPLAQLRPARRLRRRPLPAGPAAPRQASAVAPSSAKPP